MVKHGIDGAMHIVAKPCMVLPVKAMDPLS